MVKSKKIKYYYRFLLYIYLLIFPFGQLVKFHYKILSWEIGINPIDIIPAISIIFIILEHKYVSDIVKYIYSFIAISIFSLVFSLSIFNIHDVFFGSLYLLRFIGYTSFFIILVNYFKKYKKEKKKIFQNLIKLSFIIALIGWIQYLLVPDLRFLKYFGWDDHLNRLISTFFDPGYTGILLVLGFFLAFVKFINKRNIKLMLLMIFMIISIGFTYARASYLALFSGLVIASFIYQKVRKYLWVAIIIFSLMIFLPRTEGEGVKLERVSSVYARLSDYQQSKEIIMKYPLFGIGYNNMCPAKLTFTDFYHRESHACFGSDSSLLLVMATTGVVGFLIFMNMAIRILRKVGNDIYGNAFLISSAALFVNSFFINSLFYSWIMGWMAILLALAYSKK